MGETSVESSQKSVYQLVDKVGKPSIAAHTMPLWVDNSETDVFSMPTSGNKIESFVCGKSYFEDLVEVCDNASSEIYIAGWQVNWDAQLAKGLRLYDLLLRCAKRGVKIYVMPWNDTEPIQTYDDQTKIVLESINDTIGGHSKGRVYVSLSSSFANVNDVYFSHHQKQVIVDRKIAYVGGMDICYGRYDDDKFDLDPAADGRQVLNRYNPGIPALKSKLDAVLVDPDLMSGAQDSFGIKFRGKQYLKSTASGELDKIAKGGWQVPYNKAGTAGVIADIHSVSSNDPDAVELDELRQPRMPWQDIHARLEGPAVSALLKNFILRWNVSMDDSSSRLKAEPAPTAYPSKGKAHIQVLRSAPANHCQKEFKANAGRKLQRGQKDIYIAMKNLIAKSTRFIYIENQFFVSDFGKIGGPEAALSPAAAFIKGGKGGIGDKTLGLVRWKADGDVDALPKNTILKCLLGRLRKVILDDQAKPKFHVYITLPVHPEGPLTDGSIAVQVYYTMQTLVHGSHSLINGIRRLIKARELKDQKDKDFARVLQPNNSEYESVSADACLEYVTLMNLRNWKQIGKGYVTEQIYVHSKLMIVDDRFALLGSANVNDRSLLGERDSEIAILVMDDNTRRADINGKGSNQPVRVFAHELRCKIWAKLFGISAGKPHDATELIKCVGEPGSPATWKAIQKRAKENTTLYENAFPFIPRNLSAYTGESASILPTWKDGKGSNRGLLASLMPSQKEFWTNPFVPKNPEKLSQIKGFITLIPLLWTEGENNRILYPTPLIVNNEADPADANRDGKLSVAQESSSKVEALEEKV